MVAVGVSSLKLRGLELPVTKRNAPFDMEIAAAAALLFASNTNRSSLTWDDGPTDRFVSSKNVRRASESACVLTSSSAKTSLPSVKSRVLPLSVPDTLFCTLTLEPIAPCASAGEAATVHSDIAMTAPSAR